MPRKVRELLAELQRAGAQEQPGKGSHRKFTHPLVAGHISISGKPGADAEPYQERDVRAFLRKIEEAQRSQP